MAFTPDFQASEFLATVSHLTLSIAAGIRNNSFDRKEIQNLLSELSERALSDGRLIDAARCDIRSVHHALNLLKAHTELILYLVSQNYILPAASIKWYSCKKLFRRNRLPIFHQALRCARIRSMIEDMKDKEAVVLGDMLLYQVS